MLPKAFCDFAYQDICLDQCILWCCWKQTGQYLPKYHSLIIKLRLDVQNLHFVCFHSLFLVHFSDRQSFVSGHRYSVQEIICQIDFKVVFSFKGQLLQPYTQALALSQKLLMKCSVIKKGVYMQKIKQCCLLARLVRTVLLHICNFA